jgi:tRNA(Arg) A34 adenosine deaminase TadA
MSTAKKVILFSVLLFAVYSQYKAEQTVKKNRGESQRTRQGKEEVSTPQQDQFMTRALELSQVEVGEDQGPPGGSVIVKEGKIIGEGWNSDELSMDPAAHAEVQSIINACKNLDTQDLAGTDIYAAVQPCPRCLSMISIIGIEKVYYCVPRWKIKQFDNGRSPEYVVEQLAKQGKRQRVREIQLLTSDADKYVSRF